MYFYHMVVSLKKVCGSFGESQLHVISFDWETMTEKGYNDVDRRESGIHQEKGKK